MLNQKEAYRNEFSMKVIIDIHMPLYAKIFCFWSETFGNNGFKKSHKTFASFFPPNYTKACGAKDKSVSEKGKCDL